MDTSDSNIRIPGVLMPAYNRLINTEEGRSAMKRIRVECGVCKATRFYSIHRGITRIAGVVACEGCRQFYQRFKKQPRIEQCEKGGRCSQQDEMPKRCKACGVAHILSHCPVPPSLYHQLLVYLPADIRKRMPERPLAPAEVPEEKRGALGLEVYKGDTWEDVTDKDEVQALTLRTEDDMVIEDTSTDLDIDYEDLVVDDPDMSENCSTEDPPSPISLSSRTSRHKKSRLAAKDNSDPDQRTAQGSAKGETLVMASLLEGLKVNNQFMENFNPKTSERVRRKKKKVQYFNSTGRGKNPHPSAFHGPDGSLVLSGKDLCDCLIGDCPGCHFPCSKCGSGKCGKECRINRKWYYDKVEVEGSTLSWNNEYMKKL